MKKNILDLTIMKSTENINANVKVHKKVEIVLIIRSPCFTSVYAPVQVTPSSSRMQMIIPLFL
jgi:hypothetical protein